MTVQGFDYLVAEIRKAINYTREEYDMTYAEVIGALEFIKIEIIDEACEE